MKKIHISEAVGTVIEEVKSFDQAYHVSEQAAELGQGIKEKAVEIDQTYHISDNVAIVGESIKGTIIQLEQDHHISQRANEVAEVVVTGVETGVQQVSQFLQTNETAKTGVEFITDVSNTVGNALNGFWNSLTSPQQPTTPIVNNSPQINVNSHQ